MKSKHNTGKNLSDSFPIQSGLKHAGALLPLLFQLFFRICH